MSNRVPWNKGMKMSQEYREKLSKAHKGQTPWIKGKHHSEEAKQKMSVAKMGKTSPRKGVKLSDEMRAKFSYCQKGKHHSEETKKKISDCLKGHKSHTLGMKWSDETKQKMSISQKNKWLNKNKEQREKEIKKLIEYPKKILHNTSIERKVEKDLQYYNINYVKQKFLFNESRNFVVDFYIPSLKLVIECNGDYWHSLPDRIQRDKDLKEYVERSGHKIIFIWEHEINDEWFDIMDYIK